MKTGHRIPSLVLQTRFARKAAWATLGMMAFGMLGAAHAQDITTRPYLLGDWGGLRTQLAEQGISFNFSYGSQVAHNFTGGDRELTRYTDQWAGTGTFDLDKLAGWKGATFQIAISNRNGRNLGADANIGNNMLLQEVYGRGQTVHLTQFWLNQKLLDDRLQIKFGRLTLGEDFAAFSCDFQNLTFCGSQPGNLVGGYWLNWPTSTWGARLRYDISREFYGQVGVYQVNPTYADDRYARRSGWKLNNPSGTTGALIPVEGGWLTRVNGRPGSYKIGVWYNTSEGEDLYQDVNHEPRGLTGLDARERNGQYGVYLNFEQQITGTAGGSGASVFLNISQADRATAQTDGQIALGLQYKGPFGRPNDSIGVAVGATHNNGRYARYVRQVSGPDAVVGDGYEYVGEVHYTWSPIPSVYLRPNLQYVLNPGGTSQNHDAFVVGLKTGITF